MEYGSIERFAAYAKVNNLMSFNSSLLKNCSYIMNELKSGENSSRESRTANRRPISMKSGKRSWEVHFLANTNPRIKVKRS